MPLSAPNVDPLHSFVAGARTAGTQRPVPLVATRFDVRIDSGLAIVTTSRTFRNDEKVNIEATITFPVPVHAVLFSLEARLENRVLKARACRKTQARENYEDALERGKTAILHEEVLRGVHMLSVGHIPPGAEIEVITVWAMTLTNINGVSRLRIPLTVGDVYGHSGLPPSDELIHGGPLQSASLTVTCLDGATTLLGAALDGGRAEIPLNAPIDLQITGWTPRELLGRAADGREVALRIEPQNAGESALNVALALDHSGSMAEVAGSANPVLNKHQAALSGLQLVAERLRPSDVVDLWEFDNALRHIGSTTGAPSKLPDLVRALSGPSGGTEIGAALAGICAQSPSRDVLLITDGKSHALDVQGLARTGRRFSVVLIGEDSLEANVGHLAAITGGGIFIAAGGDLSATIVAALDSLRAANDTAYACDGVPNRVATRRGNMMLDAQWRSHDSRLEDTLLARAVSAVSADFALPFLDTEAATRLAEEEGLVTHLTSLILVDESTTHEGIPAMRKVPLPDPRTMAMAEPVAMRSRISASYSERPHMHVPRYRISRSLIDRSAMLDALLVEADTSIGQDEADPFTKHHFAFAALAAAIDWDAAPNLLLVGDLSLLDERVAREIHHLAGSPEVLAFAAKLQLDPILLTIGLIAKAETSGNRSAARLAKLILTATAP